MRRSPAPTMYRRFEKVPCAMLLLPRSSASFSRPDIITCYVRRVRKLARGSSRIFKRRKASGYATTLFSARLWLGMTMTRSSLTGLLNIAPLRLRWSGWVCFLQKIWPNLKSVSGFLAMCSGSPCRNGRLCAPASMNLVWRSWAISQSV